MKTSPSTTSIVTAIVVLACAIANLAACNGSDSSNSSGTGGGGGSGSGFAGVFVSTETDELALEFSSGGSVVAIMGGDKGPPGTYTIDGEKIIVSMPDSMPLTFIRDGNCIEDDQHIFGKLCKGGQAGAAKNVSTRQPPVTSGTWIAVNEDGEFRIDFKTGDTFTFTMTPAAGGQMGDKVMTSEGKFETEGDTLYASLSDSTPIVLKWVNGGYESMAFGLPMKFTRR